MKGVVRGRGVARETEVVVRLSERRGRERGRETERGGGSERDEGERGRERVNWQNDELEGKKHGELQSWQFWYNNPQSRIQY